MDALSDYDVILVIDDINPFVDDHTWLNDFGEVLLGYWDPVHPDPLTGFDICANVIQYRDGLKIDFTLWPVSLMQKIVAIPTLPAELDPGYRVLLDKDHLTKTMHWSNNFNQATDTFFTRKGRKGRIYGGRRGGIFSLIFA